jgi:predicted O-methyltransferase YrrM
LYHQSLNNLYQYNISDDDQHVYLRCFLKNPHLFEVFLSNNEWPQALTYFQKNFSNRLEFIYHYIQKINFGIFVEIGVCHGSLSEFILTNNSTCKLYCVDPYVSYDKYIDACKNEVDNKLYMSTMTKIKTKFGDRAEFIRKFSEQAIYDIAEELDFVYIDGNHSYEYVITDLELWYNKLKSGGFIICDDACDTNEEFRDSNGDIFIQWNNNSFGKYGVVHACKNFTKAKNIPYFKFDNQILIY